MKIKRHQYTFGGRVLPGPAGELQRSPDLVAAIKGSYFQRKKGKEKGMEGRRQGRKVRGGKGEEGEREIKDVAP